MKDDQNLHLKDLNSCEWDFTDIPQKELWLAEIYEYSRECEEVSNAFTNWLDSPAVLTDELIDWDTGIETVHTELHISIRELLQMAPFPKSIQAGSKTVEVDWGDFVDMANMKLLGHSLFNLLPALQQWPKPYAIARDSNSVKQGVDDLLKPRSKPKAVVLISGEEDTGDYPFGLSSPQSRLIELRINFDTNKKQILEEVGEIYDQHKTTERRGRQKSPHSLNLRQLGALRLRLRGYGRGRAITSFDSLVCKLKVKEQELGDKKHLIPLYTNKQGFIAAADKAQKRLLKEYRKYSVYHSLSNRIKDKHFF
jgi:hypothetical protein